MVRVTQVEVSFRASRTMLPPHNYNCILTRSVLKQRPREEVGEYHLVLPRLNAVMFPDRTQLAGL